MHHENEPVYPISPKCADCPAIASRLKIIKETEDITHAVTSQFTDGTFETVVDELVDASTHDPDFMDTPLDRDAFLSEVLKDQGNAIAYVERYADEARNTIKLLQLGCSGLMRMRAEKAGVRYTAEICASPQQAQHHENEDGVMRVKRTIL